MKSKADQAQTITLDRAADLSGRSRRWVQNLVQAGHVSRQDRGKYDLKAFVRGVIAHYEALLEESTSSDAANKATIARTREIELRIAKQLRDLIPLEDALAVEMESAAIVRAELSGMPARYTRDLDERRKLEAEIDVVLERIAAAHGKACAALEGEGEDLQAESEEEPG